MHQRAAPLRRGRAPRTGCCPLHQARDGVSVLPALRLAACPPLNPSVPPQRVPRPWAARRVVHEHPLRSWRWCIPLFPASFAAGGGGGGDASPGDGEGPSQCGRGGAEPLLLGRAPVPHGPHRPRGAGGLAGLGFQEGARRCEGLEAAGISPSAVFGFKFMLFVFRVTSARRRPGCTPLPAHPCRRVFSGAGPPSPAPPPAPLAVPRLWLIAEIIGAETAWQGGGAGLGWRGEGAPTSPPDPQPSPTPPSCAARLRACCWCCCSRRTFSYLRSFFQHQWVLGRGERLCGTTLAEGGRGVLRALGVAPETPCAPASLPLPRLGLCPSFSFAKLNFLPKRAREGMAPHPGVTSGSSRPPPRDRLR